MSRTIWSNQLISASTESIERDAHCFGAEPPNHYGSPRPPLVAFQHVRQLGHVVVVAFGPRAAREWSRVDADLCFPRGFESPRDPCGTRSLGFGSEHATKAFPRVVVGVRGRRFVRRRAIEEQV